MIIEVGEALHTYIAVCLMISASFLVGMQVGSFKKEHKKSN